ncbi:MAG: polynucleotide adenylyltransferase PcnB [Gammaproteobacteria bacterium]|nr:polynucleotide adenylyltransferase PcnB [Gammaproteobacteria bacterium]
MPDPAIIPPDRHRITQDQIDPEVIGIIAELRDAGYEAYLVGGSIRDLLQNAIPKDFDVATSALPDEVKLLFKRRCRLIGRRFRLAHVYAGRDIIEVATFRAQTPPEEDNDRSLSSGGRILRDNVYGDRHEDALRRDFTANALYYDPETENIIDDVGGFQDIQANLLRLIGDPAARYREDPVRMLRAVRFAAKLGFNIDPDTANPIYELAPLLREVPPARLFDESLKLFLSGHAEASDELLCDYDLFHYLFPYATSEEFQPEESMLLDLAFRNTDERIAAGKPVTPAFLFAAIQWGPVHHAMEKHLEAGKSPQESLLLAQEQQITNPAEGAALPKRFGIPMREIWSLQWRLHQRQGQRPYRLLSHPRFRAAYDFLLLRNEAGEPLQELCDWWTEFQEASDERRQQMQQGLPPAPGRRKRKPRRKKATPQISEQ